MAVVQRLNPAEFRNDYQQGTAELIDVRTPGEYGGGHLRGAKNYDFLGGEFTRVMNGLDRNRTYYLYCASGNRSGTAAQMMLNAGFTRVYNIGGYGELASAGLPVE